MHHTENERLPEGWRVEGELLFFNLKGTRRGSRARERVPVQSALFENIIFTAALALDG